MRLRLLIFMLICIPVSSLLAEKAEMVFFDSAFEQFHGVVGSSPVYGFNGDRLFGTIGFQDTIYDKYRFVNGYYLVNQFVQNKKLFFSDIQDSSDVDFANTWDQLPILSNGFQVGWPKKSTNQLIVYNFAIDSFYYINRTVGIKSKHFKNPDSVYIARITTDWIIGDDGELYTVAYNTYSDNAVICKLENNRDWLQVSDVLDIGVMLISKATFVHKDGTIVFSNNRFDSTACIRRLNTDGSIDTLLNSESVEFISDPLGNEKSFLFPNIIKYDEKANILYGVNQYSELIFYKDNKWHFDTLFYLNHKGKYRGAIKNVLIDSNSTQYFLFGYIDNAGISDSLFIRHLNGDLAAFHIPGNYERMFFDDKGKIWITGSKGEYLGKAVVYDPYSQTTSVEEYASYLPTLHPKEVLPNPASGKVTAKFWGINRYVNSMNVGLYNSNGVKLKDLDEYVVYDKYTEKGSIEFSVSDLPSGVYYLLYTAKEIKKLQGLIINR